MERTNKKSHSDDILLEIAQVTTNPKTLGIIVGRLTSVIVKDRSFEDSSILRAAIMNPNINKKTLRIAKAKEEVCDLSDRDAALCELIGRNLSAMLRTETETPNR